MAGQATEALMKNRRPRKSGDLSGAFAVWRGATSPHRFKARSG
jgi:hypothetical protein